MFEEDDNVVFPVDMQEVVEFANSLYGYLYYRFELEPIIVEERGHFKHIIGNAVLHIQKHARKFNNEVLDRCCFEVPKSTLCQKIFKAYPQFPYFNNLYLISAFILDLVLWCNRHLEAANLTEGPSLWIEIFQNNFDSEFVRNGGWQGFAEAGRVWLARPVLPKEEVTADYFMCVMSGLNSLIPTCEDTTDVIMDEVEGALDKLKLSPIKKISLVEVKEPQIESALEELILSPRKKFVVERKPQIESAIEELKLSPRKKVGIERKRSQIESALEELKLSPIKKVRVVEVKEPQIEGAEKPEQVGENPSRLAVRSPLGGRGRRKRAHDADPADSEAERDSSLSPSKAKLDKTKLDTSG